MMNSVNTSERPLAPLTDRQRELMRIIQTLPADSRHTLTVVFRGTEPWEVQTIIEHRKLGELKPGSERR
jgi:type II secretory pathway component PulJ